MRRAAVTAVLVLLARLTPAHALDAPPLLEGYVLFATDALRVAGATVTTGDLGVDHGTLTVSGPLAAPAAQLVGDVVRLRKASQCAGVVGNHVVRPPASCPLAGSLAGAILDDVAGACGLPTPFASCDAAAAITVASGEVRTLAPGTYGAVVVARGPQGPGTLVLTGGEYVFCSLGVRRGAQVQVHTPSRISVVGDVRLDARAQLGPAPGVALTARDIRLFGNGGWLRVLQHAELHGRWCGPGGRATLSGATLDGTVVAGRITAVRSMLAAPYTETRVRCTQHDPLRRAFFGDLHVHTTLSFDAHAFDVRTTPTQAYGFAQGAAVAVPPLDVNGQGTQTLQLERPLDFAAVTDHSEFLGEVETCITPGSATYDSATCQGYRAGGNSGTTLIAYRTAIVPPSRDPAVCGADGAICRDAAGAVWSQIQDAAAAAYDRTDRCSFTSFVGYEYTGTANVSTLHRNVIFRNDHVPFPTTVFEQPTASGLWTELKATCLDSGIGCDVLAIPHNSNESNGKMFLVEYPGAGNRDEERAQAELRAALEPVAEIYQHKGSSECLNGLSGIVGAPDEQCDFERRWRGSFTDCGDGTGVGGTITSGCVSRRDFVRGALLEGLKEAERIGVNPLRLGIVASTDTHNGTPGAVEERSFIGHRGEDDDTPAKQLGTGQFYLGGNLFSGGGLVGVWAEENSRSSIFDALRRREVFGTSGPRIAVRFFGGWNLAPGLCTDPNLVQAAYDGGVPMGGFLPAPPAGAGAPTFVVSALRDAGTIAHPGVALQRIQIIKGWLDQGQAHQQVFDVAGDAGNGATVDEATCTPQGPGADTLCAVWTDPGFVPEQQAFYYVRVLENPTCRWSTYTCNALAPVDRPPACTDPAVPKTVQERAWTSPIWYQPAT